MYFNLCRYDPLRLNDEPPYCLSANRLSLQNDFFSEMQVDTHEYNQICERIHVQTSIHCI